MLANCKLFKIIVNQKIHIHLAVDVEHDLDQQLIIERPRR